MRKALLMGVPLLLFAAGPAFAHGNDGHDGNQGGDPGKSVTTIDGYLAASLSGNSSAVSGNTAKAYGSTNAASISGSFGGTTGVSNENQNVGQNSALQNALSLTEVKGCDCATGGTTIAIGVTLAGAANTGAVTGNAEKTGKRVTTTTGTGWQNDHFPPPPPIKTISYGPVYDTASISNSYDGVIGVNQVNQNAGDNSLLQNTAAVGATGPLKGNALSVGVAIAGAGNSGAVENNSTNENVTTSATTMSNSFNGATGVVNANQNAGANSALQNATAVAAVTTCGCTSTSDLTLGGTVAAAYNTGTVGGNLGSTYGGGAGASMTSSFNGSTGVLQASQNSGANSLLQNSVAVGVVAPQ
jgi:hypothetical protein